MGELVPARASRAAGPRRRAVTATAVRGLSRFAEARGVPSGRASSTRGTYRSAPYRLAEAAHGPAGQRATPFAGARAPAPYAPAERAELAAVAAAQRDPARRASALAMVVFGIGAGLRPGELVALRGGDVARHGRQVLVHITGPAARVVPVTSCYAGRAAELARRAGSGHVFRPGPADRSYKNFVTNFARGLAADPAAPQLTAGRARATFICGHLAAGTPVPVLLAVTGIAEAGSLARYARHLARRQLPQGRPAGPLARGAHAMSGTGLTLPAASGGVSDQTAAFAAELIDRSGKAPVIEAALAHRTGRPRPLPARAVLTALLCLALDDRPLFLTDATRLLFCQPSPASRGLLGVPGTATTERAFQAAYRRVRYCFGAIRPVMDPSALPKNRRLTQDDLKARTRPMTPAQAEAARGRLEAFINSLLEASISILTSEERAAYDGCTGLDATPGPAVLPRPVQARRPVRQRPRRRLARPRRRPPRTRRQQRKAAAQDRLGAGSHHRHHGPPARRTARAPRSRHRPGAGPARRRPRRHRHPGPGLRRRPRAQARLARLRPCLHRCATRAIPAARARPGLPAGHGLPDRPARHPGQHRRRHPGRGHLVLPRPARAAHHRDRPPARPRHHPRAVRPADHRPRPYQLKRKDGPDADGYQRLSCPAACTHPGLICPLREASLSPRDGRAKVLQPPPQPPRLCRQTAITIAPDIGARYRQDLPYGSPAWHARHATLRNTIEGLNGYAKDPAREALAQPARRRVRGIAAQSIFTALLLTAANIRKIRAWRALTARDKTRITRRARRRRTSLRDHLPDG